MSVTWRKKITHTTEFLVRKGSAIGECHKAVAVAWVQFCDATGTDRNSSPWDDWATVDFDDEHVIIRILTTDEVA